jgi:transcriptional regulator CtsR
MKSTYKKKSRFINTTGYTPGYDTERNPVNYIPSENITMANTPYPVRATPLDSNGNPIGESIIMSPGGEYKFNGASYVEEKPFFQEGGQNMFTVSGNQPLIIPSQGSYPFDYNKNLPVNEAGMPYVTDTDGKKILLSSSRKVPTKDEFGNNLSMKQIRENQKVWNDQKEAYSPGQDDFNTWKNNAENTQQGFYNRREYDKIVKKFNKLPDVEQEGTCDPNFDSTNCGISKAAAKQSKKDFKRKEEGGFFKTKQNNMDSNMMPNFGNGGEKNKWISAKISKLVREEGYPQKQAVAMAYEMYDKMHKNGGYQLPMYQAAGQYNFGNTFAGSNFAKPQFSADPNIQSPEAFSASLDKITEVNPGEYGLGKDPNKPNPLSSDALTAGQDFKKRTDEIGKAAGVPETMSTNVFGAEVEDSKPKTETTGLQKPDIQGNQPFQFFNPYSGVDIPTAGVMFGQSLENKDTLGAVASGAKVVLGTARNIFGGMGQARRENYVKKQYAEKQREGMTGQGREQMARFGGYYQEGGMQPEMEQGMEEQGGQEQQIMQEVAQMLQQGADPQQVIQQLVQMGVPEDQALQMVQAVMQEMQGSTPQLKRGGMMYYQDGGEDDEDGGVYGGYGEDEYGYEDEEEPNYMINKPSLMGKRQNFSEPALAISPAIESAVESTSPTKEEAPSYDKNSARDTWVAKTGMPWSEAKRLGYTTGSAKDNIKLLSELNDPRFNKKYLRSKPLSPAKKKSQNINAYGIDTNSDYVTNWREEQDRKAKQASIKQQESTKNKSKNVNAYGIDTNSDYIVKWREEQDKKSRVKEEGGYYQGGGNYDTYNEKDFKDNDIVRHSGGNTGLTKSEVSSLAKHYKMSPQEFLNIVSYGEPGEGMSTKYELFIEGSDKSLPKNWRDTYNNYKQNKPSTTGFRGALNKGLGYIGVDPIFNMGGYYQDGGEQQITQQAAQALQQGAQPQQVMQMLLESGMTQDQAVQLVQAIMQQIQQQGGMEEGTPQMRRGGEMIRREDGSYSRRGLWDNIRDNRGSGKEPTKEMLEQEAKIKANKKEIGGYMYAEGGINNPGFRALPDYVQEKIMGNMYQEGGMEPGADPQQEEQMQAIMQQVAQMLQQGAQPEEILQMLIEAGVPEDQATQMVQAAMQQMQEPQETPQMRDGGIPERYKKMGFGKVGAKKQSTRPGKKWMVLAKKGDQYKVVHGGDDSMKDFSQHGSEDRKENFWNRMGGRDSAKANDPFSPLYWHKKFGTWQEGGEMMDEQMEGENEGMENESAMLEQIESQVEEALKQGADPEEVLQQLIQMGVPEEQAVQMIQEILGEIQGGETESEAPEMENGGYYLNALKGKTIKDYTFNSKTGKYEVSYE